MDHVIGTLLQDLRKQLVEVFRLIVGIDPGVDVGLSLEGLDDLGAVAVENGVADQQDPGAGGIGDLGLVEPPALAVGMEAGIAFRRGFRRG